MKKQLLPLLFASIAILSACKKDDDKTEVSGADSYTSLKMAAVSNYSNIVEASYADAITTAETLQSEINAFITSPSADGLEECKTAWLAAREPYGQTEAYRFYNGPIDGQDEGEPEGALNAWPLDEAVIDYTRNDLTAGFINNTDFKITSESIRSVDGDVTGYHAIEFMLWGQDFFEPSDVNSAGETAGTRVFTDFTETKNFEKRKTYLALLATLLLEDLNTVHTQWEQNGAYRSSFEADANSALEHILTGLGELAGPELGGERMQAALSLTKLQSSAEGQEDEHSCFSDNTHRDIILNFLGCKNVLDGTYTRIDGFIIKGTSILSVIKERNSEVATQLETKTTEIVTSTKAIEVPFDIALTNDQTDIENTITALDEFSLLIADAKLALTK